MVSSVITFCPTNYNFKVTFLNEAFCPSFLFPLCLSLEFELDINKETSSVKISIVLEVMARGAKFPAAYQLVLKGKLLSPLSLSLYQLCSQQLNHCCQIPHSVGNTNLSSGKAQAQRVDSVLSASAHTPDPDINILFFGANHHFIEYIDNNKYPISIVTYFKKEISE